MPIATSVVLETVFVELTESGARNLGIDFNNANGQIANGAYALAGYAQGYPTISQREASTSATVRDGESFVIGGLTQESELGHHVKVPGLGDIPVLGRLFEVTHASSAKTELYVVVTPHVTRAGDRHDGPQIATR